MSDMQKSSDGGEKENKQRRKKVREFIARGLLKFAHELTQCTTLFLADQDQESTSA